ncbi:MAG: DUF222 domain-containing protein [Nocardioides sp.]
MSGLTAPAELLGGAREQVQLLDERLWAAAGDEELVAGVEAVEAIKAHLTAIEAGMLAELDTRDVARKQLHWGSTSDWFTHLAGLTRRDGRRAVVHARQLVAERPATLEALRRGETSPTQAAIICDAVDLLPGDTALRREGERVLLEESRRLNATDLGRAGRHLAHVVDPDRAERKAEAELAREERVAHAGRYFSVTDDGAGGVRLKGRGSVEDGAVLRAALLPLTKPVPATDPDDPTCESEADPRDHGARMWDGLIGLAQHSLDTERQPAGHGARPRLSLLIDWATLVARLGEAGVTDDGLEVSVAAVRRMACDADIIPVCLGTNSEVLDVGRTARLVTPALWRALVARDRHCTFPGCTRPPVMGHAHHLVHWVDGGGTSLDNLVLLCGEHHRVLHDTPWQVRLAARDAKPEFLPPTRARTETPDTLDQQGAWIRDRPRRE